MWLILALVCFALCVALHAIVSRARPRLNRVVSYALVGALTVVVLAWIALGRYGLDIRVWAGLALYALASELYVFLFTMIGSSITARLLITLRRHTMSLGEIEAAFPTSGMVEDRMRNLESNGFIRAEGASGYALTRKGWLIVGSFWRLRSFFRRRQPTGSLRSVSGGQSSQDLA